VLERFGDGGGDGGVGVAEDERAVRTHVVDVPVAVGVGDVRALAGADVDGVAADRLVGADG
jgi:hypothetical protein